MLIIQENHQFLMPSINPCQQSKAEDIHIELRTV